MWPGFWLVSLMVWPSFVNHYLQQKSAQTGATFQYFRRISMKIERKDKQFFILNTQCSWSSELTRLHHLQYVVRVGSNDVDFPWLPSTSFVFYVCANVTIAVDGLFCSWDTRIFVQAESIRGDMTVFIWNCFEWKIERFFYLDITNSIRNRQLTVKNRILWHTKNDHQICAISGRRKLMGILPWKKCWWGKT